MSNSLLQRISSLLGLGGVTVAVADVAVSSGGLTMTYGASSAAAYFDFGSDNFTKGMFKIRMKSVAGNTTSALLALVVSKTTTFATKQQVAVLPIISAVATLAAPSACSYVGHFDNDPTTFRYARWENLGTALGSGVDTFDTEIVALP